MKMPLPMYDALKTDCHKIWATMLEHGGIIPQTPDLQFLWNTVSRVDQERQYTGAIREQLSRISFYPCSVDPVPGYRMGPWYEADLHDAHVQTAMKRILADFHATREA